MRFPRESAALLGATIALIGVLALAACGGDDGDTSGSAGTSPSGEVDTSNACAQLQTVQGTAQSVRNLDPSVTTELQYQGAMNQLRREVDSLEASLENVSEERLALWQTARADLGAALDALPAGTPPAEVLAAVEPQLDALEAAHDEISSDLGCS